MEFLKLEKPQEWVNFYIYFDRIPRRSLKFAKKIVAVETKERRRTFFIRSL